MYQRRYHSVRAVVRVQRPKVLLLQRALVALHHHPGEESGMQPQPCDSEDQRRRDRQTNIKAAEIKSLRMCGAESHDVGHTHTDPV